MQPTIKTNNIMESLLTMLRSSGYLCNWYPTTNSRLNPTSGEWLSETLVLELLPCTVQNLKQGHISKSDIDLEAKDIVEHIAESILHDSLTYPEEVHLTETRVSDTVSVFTNNYSNIARYRRNAVIATRFRHSLHIQIVLG